MYGHIRVQRFLSSVVSARDALSLRLTCSASRLIPHTLHGRITYSNEQSLNYKQKQRQTVSKPEHHFYEMADYVKQFGDWRTNGHDHFPTIWRGTWDADVSPSTQLCAVILHIVLKSCSGRCIVHHSLVCRIQTPASRCNATLDHRAVARTHQACKVFLFGLARGKSRKTKLMSWRRTGCAGSHVVCWLIVN